MNKQWTQRLPAQRGRDPDAPSRNGQNSVLSFKVTYFLFQKSNKLPQSFTVKYFVFRFKTIELFHSTFQPSRPAFSYKLLKTFRKFSKNDSKKLKNSKRHGFNVCRSPHGHYSHAHEDFNIL